MRTVTTHDECSIFSEVRRLYLIDARTDREAAVKYLRALEDVDAALIYIDSHPNSRTALDAATDKQVCEVLDKLVAEGEEFSRSKKEGKS
jgi:hypothetical protein